ncbi:MAG TPA: D-aminoacyl-tRNA deacylase [Nitrolancea sp.]|jgi:D-tyrosyl-tRNA(Tyr) deacylase|nr:D-aminoacyl-tRNA deacylase [Nitrolancea sp.]
MRILIQRVREAAVRVEGSVIGEIGQGLLLFVGVEHADVEQDAAFLATKVANLRIFEDDDGKMNRSALELGLEALVVSQFTLYADLRKGRRPSFIKAALPEVARPLVECVITGLQSAGVRVESGEFGANMQISLINDGPVTIWLDSSELRHDPNALA